MTTHQRVAGILYAVIIVLGLATTLSLQSALVSTGDPAATAGAIRESEWLLRVVITASLVYWGCEIFLTVILYLLFRPVHEMLSMAAAAIRLVTLAIFCANLLNLVLGLTAYRDDEVLASRFLDLYQYGSAIGLTLFGVNCLVTAYLLVKSSQVPLGNLLGIAGLGYLTASLLLLLLPGYQGSLTAVLLAPALVAEIWFCVALLRRRVGAR